ncbi:hypothetical protein GCM10009839_33860 [Catenulispora yoronensis]|uniref:Uncharacterized protein n=1 Tax=Catenulispora yoronensis TaxID=450799 RepID=A0ABP5FP89_9ACTN
MTFVMNETLATRLRRTGRWCSPIGRAADIALAVADVLTRLNVNVIPDLDAAAIHLREAARLVNTRVPAARASHPYRHTVRRIGLRLRGL